MTEHDRVIRPYRELYDVERSLARDLVGDIEVAMFRIPCPRSHRGEHIAATVALSGTPLVPHPI
jgi:hypothetical protein